MGGNGSFASGTTRYEEGRRWKTVKMLSNGIKVLELKKGGASVKLPEESHTPNSVYAIYYANGKGLKALAKYGSDGKKLYEIHTIDHKGLGSHFHTWKDGKPEDPRPITKAMEKLIKITMESK